MKKEISFESLNELEGKFYELKNSAEEMRRRENDVREVLRLIRARMEADENARAKRIEELTKQAADPSASATVRAIAQNAAQIAGAERATVTAEEKAAFYHAMELLDEAQREAAKTDKVLWDLIDTALTALDDLQDLLRHGGGVDVSRFRDTAADMRTAFSKLAR